MNALTDLSLILIPIFALLVPIIWIIAAAAVKVSRANMLHETVRHMISNGQTVPPELLAQIVDNKKP